MESIPAPSRSRVLAAAGSFREEGVQGQREVRQAHARERPAWAVECVFNEFAHPLAGARTMEPLSLARTALN
jgi:hypothetical protein